MWGRRQRRGAEKKETEGDREATFRLMLMEFKVLIVACAIASIKALDYLFLALHVFYDVRENIATQASSVKVPYQAVAS